MARGWESKSIEAQQDEASRAKEPPARPPTPEERERVQRRQTIELARRKAVADLQRAKTPAHRRQLERAIADLDGLLASPQGR
jgi:hypothetical protein